MTDEDIQKRTADLAAASLHLEGPLLPILQSVQEEFGYVPEVSLPVIAEALNLSRAEVHGVVAFYSDFRREPGGRHTVKLCRAEACQSVGADALAEEAREVLGAGFHETSADGSVSVEEVFCLGLCACGPAVMVDDRVYGRVDRAALERIAEETKA